MPFIPDWPGAGAVEIVHSAAYRNAAPYGGRRMLVVGTGNSGAEIAVDLAEGGATEVLLSVRTPPGIVRRDTAGVPSQLFGIASMHLPTGVSTGSRPRSAVLRSRISLRLACPLPSGPIPRSSSGA